MYISYDVFIWRNAFAFMVMTWSNAQRSWVMIEIKARKKQDIFSKWMFRMIYVVSFIVHIDGEKQPIKSQLVPTMKGHKGGCWSDLTQSGLVNTFIAVLNMSCKI